MVTTPTSWRLTAASRAALFDELEKIAADQAGKAQARARREKLKKWLKSTALVAAGTGAGTGAAMIGDRLISSAFGAKWRGLPKEKRLAIIGPASGIAAMGGALLARKLMEEKRKHDE